MHKKLYQQLLRFPIHDKLNEDIFQRKRRKNMPVFDFSAAPADKKETKTSADPG